MNKTNFSILYLIGLAIFLSGCPSPEIILSGENTLTAITVNDGTKDLVGSIADSNITFSDSAVAGTTQVTVKEIRFSDNASADVKKNNVIPLNKTITITAENGSTKNYMMSINVSVATMTGDGMTTTDTGDGMTMTGNPVIGTIIGARLSIVAITASEALLSGSFIKENNPHITELGILVSTDAMLNLELMNANEAPNGAVKLTTTAEQLALVNTPALTVIPLSSFAVPNLTAFTRYYFRGYAAISGGSVAYTDKINGMTLAGIYTSVPDDNFRNAILSCVNTEGMTTLRGQTDAFGFDCDESFEGTITASGNSIRTAALRSITEFRYGNFPDKTNPKPSNLKIGSLGGVEQMVNLTLLNVSTNAISSLDISYNTLLTDLYVDSNRLNSLDVSNNTALINLLIDNNALNSLDVSNNRDLELLAIDNTGLSSLDISNNTALNELHATNNLLNSLDISNNRDIEDLFINANTLSSLDISNNIALNRLQADRNQLRSLDVSNNSRLTKLFVAYNLLTSIDVSNNRSLTNLTINDNALSGSLDVSNNTVLTFLNISANKISSLDVSANTALALIGSHLDVQFNPLTCVTVSTHINSFFRDTDEDGNSMQILSGNCMMGR